MSRGQLTSTQHLILAAIAWRQPVTPYELKDYFQRVVRYLVDVPHTLLYTEPPKLAALGLVEETQEEGGRRRKTYTVTDEGLRVVGDWLASPPAKEPSLDDEAIMKLSYSALGTPSAVAALARHQVDYYQARIAALEAALLSSDHDARRRRYIRTGARLALDQARVLLTFWQNIERDPDRKVETRRTTGTDRHQRSPK